MPDFKPRHTQRARQLRNAATPAERMLWRYLARGQMGAKFSRQMPVGPYFADFLCRELGLVIELDGFSHNARPEYDLARDRWMAEQGLRVLRFPNAAVLREMEMVLAAVSAEISVLRGARDGPPRCD
ncbi:endonuclease domain-containing protein [Novosphingobium colocasiae]|uniref:DUF559 domain-containing protein n=1 Tax=Novosphingobium colocasiae TaxID=1256513 RepID=A0A918PH88_9SPHN|nr:DUF559 domain-containing protein [Novosphingobium colocasiae]GGZ09412.1 hypothetical protein GCM10011614_25360 [Novosphingobium colocasiae]